MVAPWVVPAALTGASTVGSLFVKGKKNKIPAQQRAAWDALLGFGQTGKLGNYQAGADYGGALGNFEKSAIETTGQGRLMDLLNSGSPQGLNLANTELSNLFSQDTYNPYSDQGLFKGFASSVDRSTQEASDALKRNAAFGGSLYSRDTINRLGNLQEQGQQQKANKLAELYDTFAQRRLSAVPLALQAGQTGEQINQGRIGSAFQYGGLDRNLADASAKASYADFIRKQQEEQQQIGAIQSVAGGYPQTTYSPSPYENVLAMLGTVGAYGLGNAFGGGSSGGGTPGLPSSLSLFQPGIPRWQPQGGY